MREPGLARQFNGNHGRSGALASTRKVILMAATLVLCFILSSGAAGAQSADDHGDTFATATPVSLGSSTSGRIDVGDDWDVFKIDLSSETGAVDLWAYGTDDNNDEVDDDTIGGLYDSDGTLLAFGDDSFMDFGIRQFTLRKIVQPGVYYVVVVSYRGEEVDYTLHVESVVEPGSSEDTARSLNIDSPAGGTIDTSSDVDYFRLDITEPMHLTIQVRSGNRESVDGDIVDAEGGDVRLNFQASGIISFFFRAQDGFRISNTFEPGVYYVRVTAFEEESIFDDLLGEYELISRSIPYTIHAYTDDKYTEFIKECESTTRSLNDPDITDPLYGCQWHLSAANDRDINVESAWAEGHMGEGIGVVVVDDGMDPLHEDLVDNVLPSLNHDYTGAEDIYNRIHHHGTHVTGIIAARDNSVGVRGVAPRATAYGYNLLGDHDPFSIFLNEVDAMARNRDVTAVSNNSWGFPDSPGLGPVTSFWEMAIDSGLTTGYDGKGTFYVFAAGNGHLLGDDSNLGEYSNYYGVTAVCSVDSRDGKAGYSESGANLWVCAPANDRPSSLGGAFGILTTANADRYHRDFLGTSAAAPIVSGVAALMRSANPDLTWRDLKLILAASARKNDPTSAGWEDGAQMYPGSSSSGRYHFNHEYGFGVVDAGAAVDMATEWTTVPPMVVSSEVSGEVSSETSVPVPDAPESIDENPTTFTSEITLDTSIGFTEFVEVKVAFQHESFRDLEIELVSPSGAVSKLAFPFDTYTDIIPSIDFVPLDGVHRFGSAKHLGEDPNGVWTLQITDHINVGEGTFDGWAITVYGHERLPGPPAVESIKPDTSSLIVEWNVPAQIVWGEPISYDLRYIRTEEDETVDSNWTVVDNVWSTGDGDLEYTVTGLINKVEYQVQVRAINSYGPGPWSDAFLGTPKLNLLRHYDGNENGVIDKDEAAQAISDYFDGVIDRNQAIEVINLYFGG